jgi:hypothetical protein
MAGSTAQGFYDNLMMDKMPSASQQVDFGIDIAQNKDDLLRAYQRGITSGTITLEMLNEAVCDGAKLSKLLGMEVETIWDGLGDCGRRSQQFCDHDDDDDDDDDEDEDWDDWDDWDDEEEDWDEEEEDWDEEEEDWDDEDDVDEDLSDNEDLSDKQ